MPSKEIEKGNRLMIEFMGGKLVGTERMDGHDYEMYDLPASFPIKLSTPDEFGMKRTAYLGFDTQWDWLMIVVEKIGDIAENHNDKNSTEVYKKCGEVMSSHICNSIQTIWSKVVQFITWYNQQSPSPDKPNR